MFGPLSQIDETRDRRQNGYILHRKDRNSKKLRTGGGVLIAIKKEYNSEYVPELDTNCELVWAKINLKGNGNIYICAYYRRNVTDEESLKQFETSVLRASAIDNATLIIGGDMNFPGWDWKENILKPNTAAPNLHTDFINIINNNALTQLVEEPTRLQNTLDLILTNRPGKVIRTDTIPGISDHDIVYTEFDLRPVKYHQKPRTIPLYNKANWYGMRIDLTNIKNTLLDMFKDNDCQVNSMWDIFKNTRLLNEQPNIYHKKELKTKTENHGSTQKSRKT